MKSVPENIYLKICTTSFSEAQSASLSTVELPSRCVKVQQLQQHKVQSLPRQILADALGKCQFVIHNIDYIMTSSE